MRLPIHDRWPSAVRHRPPRSLRWRLALRRPTTHWLLLACGAALVVAWTHHTEAGLDRRARSLRLESAWVATADLSGGATLTPESIERREVPADMIPGDAVDPSTTPDGRVRRPLRAGEVLVTDVMTRHAASSLAAVLDGDERGVVVPLGSATLELTVGDVVDVVAFDGAGGPDAPTSAVVAPRARVIASAADHVTLAVEAPSVPVIADALAAGQLQLALRGA